MIYMISTGLLCGALLGFIMQRGRFCLTSGFRDMYTAKNPILFYALLIAIAVQSIGVYTMIHFGLFDFAAGEFSLSATVIGGFLFGIGIVFAGGCATGTWYRAGEGLLGSWLALFGYMFMSAVMRSGIFASANENIQSDFVMNNSIAQTFNVSHWIFIIFFAVIVIGIVVRELRKPKVNIPKLPAKRTGIAHFLFEKRWHPFFSALLIGFVAMLAWPLSAATGRVFGLGITAPSANILQFLVLGDMSFINWGVFLVLGIMGGSYVAAKGSREFRFRMPDSKTAIRNFLGGNLMGVGASLAGGCSIGNGLVNTAMMTWQGWTALLFMILGTWTASYFVLIRPRKKKLQLTVQTA
ncbi:MAG TPA: YeeE/YedE family protein [Bacillota bacterium]|nr:YeeE/YedE family protein [Bacillota bacterium]